MNHDSLQLLRVEDVSRILGLGRSKTYELLATGELPSISLGWARRIPVASLQAWLERKVAEQDDGDQTR